jgi:uncharacterized protein (DUF983 family)
MPVTAITSDDSATGTRDVWQSLRRGWRQKCPCCGTGPMYGKYLKVTPVCDTCGTELHHHRADDAPPYFVMTITGHIIIGGIFFVAKNFDVSPWVQMAIWTPLLILMTLWLLPRVKGALIGYQWALKMHGFGEGEVEGADIAPADPLPPR